MSLVAETPQIDLPMSRSRPVPENESLHLSIGVELTPAAVAVAIVGRSGDPVLLGLARQQLTTAGSSSQIEAFCTALFRDLLGQVNPRFERLRASCVTDTMSRRRARSLARFLSTCFSSHGVTLDLLPRNSGVVALSERCQVAQRFVHECDEAQHHAAIGAAMTATPCLVELRPRPKELEAKTKPPARLTVEQREADAHRWEVGALLQAEEQTRDLLRQANARSEALTVKLLSANARYETLRQESQARRDDDRHQRDALRAERDRLRQRLNDL